MGTQKRERISLAEVLVYEAFRVNRDRWLKNSDLEDVLVEIQARTIRAHTHNFTLKGLVEETALYPAHRYRWSESGAERNSEYVEKLEKGKQAFEIRSEESFRIQQER